MTRLLATALTVFFVSVGVAFAGNGPTNGVYGNSGEKVVKATTVVKGATKTVKSKPTTGTLPFTGADLSIAVIGGIALFGTGFALRRASRQQKD